LDLNMTRKSNGIALALGGGGARGFAHVGVLEVLDENGIHVGAVAGSSAGAVAGAGYATGYGTYEMRHRVLKFAESKLADDTRVRNLVDHDETESCSTVSNIVGRFLLPGPYHHLIACGMTRFWGPTFSQRWWSSFCLNQI
jgi:predicted acylesterase/phospholipase RssA